MQTKILGLVEILPRLRINIVLIRFGFIYTLILFSKGKSICS